MNILHLVKTLKAENVRLDVDEERLLCYLPDDGYQMPKALQLAIKNNKTSLIQFLRDVKKTASKSADIIPVQRNQAGYLLSSQQERLWFIDQLEQGLDYTYNNVGTVHFEGKLDAALLERCFNAVVARHESLRTRFFSVDSKPLQAIDEQVTIE
ncbi:MAG: condensation domain-containing protein, partial [Psychrosphaera sp.]|nr:condensation domain-containing protein [Psychrosphaera sp.]